MRLSLAYPTRRRTVLATLLGGLLAGCPADEESGVGQGPTGEAQMNPSGTKGMDTTDSTADNSLDESGDAPPPIPPPDARSYFIAESMDFTGNGCEQDDLNDVTESLRDELDGDGWVGIRVTDAQTQPADFMDVTLRDYGRDHLSSDAAALAIYAGHGFIDKLSWGTPDSAQNIAPPEKRCIADITDDTRLGSGSGGWAKAVALLTSCTGRLACYESTLGTNDVTQLFAFNNSPVIWGNAARRFYRKSEHMASRDAWIAAMDNRPGFGKNSPVTYTRGTSEAQVLELHRSARLFAIDEIPGQQSSTWYAYTWVDNGLKNSCELPAGCIGVDE